MSRAVFCGPVYMVQGMMMCMFIHKFYFNILSVIGLAAGSGVFFICEYFTNATVLGTAQPTILAQSASTDMFVAKYTSTGDFTWAQTFGGNGTDQLQDIALDAVGNIYVGGNFNSFSLSNNGTT